MDSLEEHIMKHREELDMYRPSSSVWKKIRRKTGTRRISVYRLLSAAAMIAAITVIAVLFYSRTNRLSIRSTAEYGESRVLNSQLKETEIYYNNLANSLYKEATPLLAKYPEIEKELFTDISQLDSICSDIRKDLKDNVANQEVVEALIRNYRIKITILEEMLKTLKENEDNPVKNQSHEL
jgi:hypothetical protein